jgi:copper chaperone NosL
MSKTFRLLAALLGGLLLVQAIAACGPRPPAEPQPPEIAYGQDLCAGCGMLIDEPRLAAAGITADGTALKFDDIIEMLGYPHLHPEVEVRAWFVHDYDTEVWLRAEDAHFVHSQGLPTPMGGGVVAFATREAAAAAAEAWDGALLTYNEARQVALLAAHGTAHN